MHTRSFQTLHGFTRVDCYLLDHSADRCTGEHISVPVGAASSPTTQTARMLHLRTVRTNDPQKAIADLSVTFHPTTDDQLHIRLSENFTHGQSGDIQPSQMLKVATRAALDNPGLTGSLCLQQAIIHAAYASDVRLYSGAVVAVIRLLLLDFENESDSILAETINQSVIQGRLYLSQLS